MVTGKLQTKSVVERSQHGCKLCGTGACTKYMSQLLFCAFLSGYVVWKPVLQTI